MTCSKNLARIRTGTWATQPLGTQLRIESCNQLDSEPDHATNQPTNLVLKPEDANMDVVCVQTSN
jgi:hypothetical protein